MSRVILSLGLVFCCLVGAVLGQSAGSRSESRSVRPGPPSRAGCPSARATDRAPSAKATDRAPTPPLKKFERQPRMVRVQALVVTVSFGDGDEARSAGSLADALAKEINAEGMGKRIRISALTGGLDAVVKENAKTATIESLMSLELVTVGGQTAFVQIGQRKRRIVDVAVSRMGRTNTFQMQNVGTMMSITPQIVADGSVVVEFTIERSDLGPEEEGMVIATLEDGKEVRSPPIETLMARTTVTAASGEAVVVNDLVLGKRSKQKETFVIVRPLVMGGSDDG